MNPTLALALAGTGIGSPELQVDVDAHRTHASPAGRTLGPSRTASAVDIRALVSPQAAGSAVEGGRPGMPRAPGGQGLPVGWAQAGPGVALGRTSSDTVTSAVGRYATGSPMGVRVQVRPPSFQPGGAYRSRC
jgi:hypothetical protein